MHTHARSLPELMRRFTVPGVLLLATLAACTRHGDLAPEEVLRRAAQAVNQLQSANFVVTGYYNTPNTTALTWNAKGVLGNGGKELSFSIDVSGTLADQQAAKHKLQANADIVVAGADVYFRLQSFKIDPPHPAIHVDQAAALIGSWYKLPSSPDQAKADVTPDPGLLRAQSQVIRVTEDRGLSKVGDHDPYSYAVAADAQKLKQFLEATHASDASAPSPLIAMFSGLKGDMLINSKTFFVDRFRWTSEKPEMHTTSMTIDMILTGHNAAAPVIPPQGAVPFDPAMIRSVSVPASTTTDGEAGSFPLLPQ